MCLLVERTKKHYHSGHWWQKNSDACLITKIRNYRVLCKNVGNMLGMRTGIETLVCLRNCGKSGSYVQCIYRPISYYYERYFLHSKVLSYCSLTLGAHAQCTCRVCLSVCMSVRPRAISLHEQSITPQMIPRIQCRIKVERYVGFYLKLLRSRVTAWNTSKKGSMLIRTGLYLEQVARCISKAQKSERASPGQTLRKLLY